MDVFVCGKLFGEDLAKRDSTGESFTCGIIAEGTEKKHIFDNDQHSEGVISMIKKQLDRKVDCNEPAQYFQARYNSLKESNRVFVANFEKIKDIVHNRKENAEAGCDEGGTRTAITEYVIINDATMVDDVPWRTGTGRRGPEAKKQL